MVKIKIKPVETFSAALRDAAEREIIERSKRIDSYLTEYTVEFLADKMRDKHFVVPQYQREFTWEPYRKSRFIESVLMGLPIPFLFFWEMPDGRLEVVDGSQRLRTIEEWIHGGFKLGELEELPGLSHSTFNDLLEARQRKVKNRSIRGIVLNEYADDQARFDMFERINTGSKAAKKAEVRRGALGGPFIDLVIELAKNPAFTKVAPVPAKAINEREREELVTRFFAYGDGLTGYKDRPAAFLFEYTGKTNHRFKENPALIDQYRSRFMAMVKFIEKNTPYGFRKTATSTTSPRARFEALAVGAHLAMTSNPQLGTKSQKKAISTWIESKPFSDATTSDGANVLSKLRGRIDFVKKRLLDDAGAT